MLGISQHFGERRILVHERDEFFNFFFLRIVQCVEFFVLKMASFLKPFFENSLLSENRSAFGNGRQRRRSKGAAVIASDRMDPLGCVSASKQLRVPFSPGVRVSQCVCMCCHAVSFAPTDASQLWVHFTLADPALTDVWVCKRGAAAPPPPGVRGVLPNRHIDIGHSSSAGTPLAHQNFGSCAALRRCPNSKR